MRQRGFFDSFEMRERHLRNLAGFARTRRPRAPESLRGCASFHVGVRLGRPLWRGVGRVCHPGARAHPPEGAVGIVRSRHARARRGRDASGRLTRSSPHGGPRLRGAARLGGGGGRAMPSAGGAVGERRRGAARTFVMRAITIGFSSGGLCFSVGRLEGGACRKPHPHPEHACCQARLPRGPSPRRLNTSARVPQTGVTMRRSSTGKQKCTKFLRLRILAQPLR